MRLRSRIARLEQESAESGRRPRLVFANFEDFVRRLLTRQFDPADLRRDDGHVEHVTRLFAIIGCIADPSPRDWERDLNARLRWSEMGWMTDDEWAAFVRWCRRSSSGAGTYTGD